MSFVSGIDYAIRTYLNSVLDIIVIPDYDGGTEPVEDYCVVGITTFNKLNRDSNHFYKTDTGFEELIRQHYEVVLTASFYGDSCYDNAFKAQALLQLNDTREQLDYTDCISNLNISNVMRIPEIRETDYVQRATFDINILTAFEFVKEIDWFDTVKYSGEYLDLDESIVLQEDETVSANDPSPFN